MCLAMSFFNQCVAVEVELKNHYLQYDTSDSTDCAYTIAMHLRAALRGFFSRP